METPQFSGKKSSEDRFTNNPTEEQLEEAEESIKWENEIVESRAKEAGISPEEIEQQDKKAKGWRSGKEVNPSGEVETRDSSGSEEKFSDFVERNNEKIRLGLIKLEEVLSPEVSIRDDTGRGFTRELASFYILKAIRKWHDEWSKKFIEAKFEGLKDVVQVDIEPKKTAKGPDWARFTLIVELKLHWADKFFNKFNFLEKISPKKAKFVFHLSNEEEIFLES